MRSKPICLKRKIVAKSKLFEIEQMKLKFSNGNERCYERIIGYPRGAVLVVAITHDAKMILINEYTAGTDRYEWGFPKGLIDPGENLFQAANRELQEEVGFAANQLEFIKTVSINSGYFGSKLEVVLAWDLYPQQLSGDEPEPLEIIYWPLNATDELLIQEEFTEARSIAAMFMIERILKKRKK